MLTQQLTPSLCPAAPTKSRLASLLPVAGAAQPSALRYTIHLSCIIYRASQSTAVVPAGGAGLSAGRMTRCSVSLFSMPANQQHGGTRVKQRSMHSMHHAHVAADCSNRTVPVMHLGSSCEQCVAAAMPCRAGPMHACPMRGLPASRSVTVSASARPLKMMRCRSAGAFTRDARCSDLTTPIVVWTWCRGGRMWVQARNQDLWNKHRAACRLQRNCASDSPLLTR